MGAQFLEVDFEEDGSAAGGYAKEMSKEWHAAAREMLTKQCSDVDIVITTALIPGRTAPVMVTKEVRFLRSILFRVYFCVLPSHEQGY